MVSRILFCSHVAGRMGMMMLRVNSSMLYASSLAGPLERSGMNIYVGNLPYSMGDAELRQLFEEFGAVSSASVVKDKFTGRSRGFGFVEMADGGEASRAIESTNGRSLAGRGLVVNEARPREERPRGNWGGGGGGGRDRY
jgi:RNA recognition motif-containing protein